MTNLEAKYNTRHMECTNSVSGRKATTFHKKIVETVFRHCGLLACR